MDALDDAINNSVPNISGGLTPEDGQKRDDGPFTLIDDDKKMTLADQHTPLSMTHANHEELVNMITSIQKSQDELNAKVDRIVEVVESTVNNLGNNPMMQMLSKLAPKAKG